MEDWERRKEEGDLGMDQEREEDNIYAVSKEQEVHIKRCQILVNFSCSKELGNYFWIIFVCEGFLFSQLVSNELGFLHCFCRIVTMKWKQIKLPMEINHSLPMFPFLRKRRFAVFFLIIFCGPYGICFINYFKLEVFESRLWL